MGRRCERLFQTYPTLPYPHYKRPMLTRLMSKTLPATAPFGLVNLGTQMPGAKASLTKTLSPMPNLCGLLLASHSEADQCAHCDVFSWESPHAHTLLTGLFDSFHCIQPWSACCIHLHCSLRVTLQPLNLHGSLLSSNATSAFHLRCCKQFTLGAHPPPATSRSGGAVGCWGGGGSAGCAPCGTTG